MTDDKRDPPIEPLPYLGGVTTVDFGDYRVSRGMTRRHHSGCGHKRMVYDQNERRVWCKDCERDLEPFDAFRLLVEAYSYSYDNLMREREKLDEAIAHNLVSVAAKNIDKVWRKRGMIPICPNCKEGLHPFQFKKHSLDSVSIEYDLARKKRRETHTHE